MTESIVVITPTVPGREANLERAIRSVAAQSIPVLAHIVIDEPRPESGGYVCERIARSRNIGLGRAPSSTWIAFLDDDNWWEPDHLAVLLDHSENADVVSTPTFIEWDESHSNGKQCNSFDAGALGPEQFQQYQLAAWGSLVDTNALVRKSLIDMIGGFCESWEIRETSFMHGNVPITGMAHLSPSGCVTDDQDFFYRLSRVGARFRYIDKPTWHYEQAARSDPRGGPILDPGPGHLTGSYNQ